MFWEALPDCPLPAHIVPLPAVPLGPNGKVEQAPAGPSFRWMRWQSDPLLWHFLRQRKGEGDCWARRVQVPGGDLAALPEEPGIELESARGPVCASLGP